MAHDEAANTDVVARARADLHAAGGALLIDLEFTCWEDSLRTDWADPACPAELLEIGLADYRLSDRVTGASFSELVRPRVNPTLSRYCVDLLHIEQRDVDAAAELPLVLERLEHWLRILPATHAPTCGWGAMDRVRLATNARTCRVPDPLAGRPHIDLCAVMTTLHDHPTPEKRAAN